MKKTFLALGLFLMMCPSFAQPNFGQRADDGKSLKDAYKDYFTIGVAVNQRNVSDEAQMALIRKEFNSVTAENDWKPGEIHPKEGVWNFEKADKIADFCRQNGIKMRGHCLCWHSQFADWMFTDKKGKEVKKEVFYERLREHIHTIMNRYKDVVYAWDVVNEAMADDGGRRWPGQGEPSPYRQSRHFKLCGDEFIAKAFEFAREADPDALLLYNDYSCVDEGKRERIYNMVKKMKDAGVPIDGIGMQGHYNIYFPDEDQLDLAITRFKELVKHIHITELDLRMNNESGGQLMFSRGEAKPMPAYMGTLQTDQYARLFKVFRKHADVIDNVTFWNLGDRDSWLGVNNHPLPFDEKYQPKPCYRAIRDFNPALDNVAPVEDFKPSELNQPGQQYPMVNSQGYARFRVEAPDAKSVIVSLGLGGRGGTVLRKGKDGYWWGTTEGPMDEGFHYYHLTIDGGTFNDPGAQNFYGSVRWESGIEIPAHDRDFYALKNVPHGNIQEIQFWSESTQSMKRAFVYTPANYGQPNKKGKIDRYPVLYLQHGWGEDETAWSRQGHAGLILDNLIADGKCAPCMIVMTYGMTNELKWGHMNEFDWTAFQRVLMDELVPYVDSHFFTIADRDHRAMTGLSMGGMETRMATLARPEMFGYWGLFSGGIYEPKDLQNVKAPRRIFLSCGERENPDRINQAVNELKSAGFDAYGHVSPQTGHEFLTWRRALNEWLPLLFK